MVLVRRFGGWRPVEDVNGVGALRLRDGRTLAGVRYSFEVWHQFAQGFHGPYRAEGRISGPADDNRVDLVGQEVLLELEDGRFLPVRISPDGVLLAHAEPTDSDPWAQIVS